MQIDFFQCQGQHKAPKKQENNGTSIIGAHFIHTHHAKEGKNNKGQKCSYRNRYRLGDPPTHHPGSQTNDYNCLMIKVFNGYKVG